ncbi:hypothetical protein [Cupriavidus sp. CuC1]|uniref:hypothetical protein n=1 Tax=Cupriavidus sp. CuC1 TaxID=3373131 RepID=UPI0037D790DF
MVNKYSGRNRGKVLILRRHPSRIAGAILRRGSASRALAKARIESETALAEQRKADAVKAIAQAREAGANKIGSLLDSLRKNLPAFAVSYGVVVAFLYFSLAVNFFPSGVNVGDALLLLFMAFGYGFLSVFFVAGGLLIVVPAAGYLDALGENEYVHEGGVRANPPKLSLPQQAL